MYTCICLTRVTSRQETLEVKLECLEILSPLHLPSISPPSPLHLPSISPALLWQVKLECLEILNDVLNRFASLLSEADSSATLEVSTCNTCNTLVPNMATASPPGRTRRPRWRWLPYVGRLSG